jgi:hypothetical protein
MRPRAGTEPVTLEPSRVLEILALARDHDEKLKAVQQDLFRAETKMRIERKWKWPVRFMCVGIGVGLVALLQNEALMAQIATQANAVWREFQAAGNAALIMLIVAGLTIYGLVQLLRHIFREETPEEQARKLMEQFAQKDGVAAYVFAPDETPDDEAASIGALTRPENKKLRQRHFTASHRTLHSSMNRIIHRIDDDISQTILH